MSLTFQLRNAASPVSQFMRQQFPNVRPFQKQARDALREAKTIRPPQARGYAYSTVGTALDYRVRYYLAVTPPGQFVAASAATRLDLTGIGPEFAETFREGFQPALQSLTKERNPVGRCLDHDDEMKLLRFCVVLALFDEFYRAGMGIADRSPLMQAEPDDYESWLMIPKPEWLDDLRQLSWLFYERGKHLFSETAVLNPQFAGSRDVGGADADMIVNGRLLDVKTSVKPDGSKIKEWLYQALGYVLLDYGDEFKLTGLDFYLARQGVFLRWPLAEAVEALADGKAPPLQELRERFRNALAKI